MFVFQHMLCAGCMQLTEEQADDWTDDANVMLSEENLGGTSVRASGEALLQSLVGSSNPNCQTLMLETITRLHNMHALFLRSACRQC